ncbi:MAG: hypothetical protein M3077_09745 [Candidatus Dormibacteraeota bacterium]|nr:hypothetical protein [Candidatus Dormibacteraeota bacterium]
MPSHLLRRVAWGLVWRWSILFASLIAPAPFPAIAVVSVLLAAGTVTFVWRRQDWLGSAWRVLLAVAVVNLGFWLGSPWLVPAITIALVLTLADLWWSISDTPASPVADVAPVPVSALQPMPAAAVGEPVAYLRHDPVYEPIAYRWQEPVYEPVAPRRRASRGSTAAGFRMLVAACLAVTVLTVAAFTAASRASAGLSGALAAFGQRIDQLTAAAPAGPAGAPTATAPPAAQPTPSPTPDPITALIPNNGDGQPSLDQGPRIDISKLCVSLSDHRYEIRLPNGQVIIVKTKHHEGCPDLSVILKALQNAGGDSN